MDVRLISFQKPKKNIICDEKSSLWLKKELMMEI